jgi:hypothetical protein
MSAMPLPRFLAGDLAFSIGLGLSFRFGLPPLNDLVLLVLQLQRGLGLGGQRGLTHHFGGFTRGAGGAGRAR